MAKGYRPVDREQGFLLPPDMREWLPADHQVWLLLEVVSEHLDTTSFHARRRTGGVGRAGYDPDMLLTVLIWAYAQGVHSSRRIERLCQQDVAFRIICGGNLPDHTAIARFRAEFADAVVELFSQVLQLCARLGMGRLATITLDGTKITASASMKANRRREWLAEQAARTGEHAARTGDHADAVARRAVAEHAATDAEQDALWGPRASPDTVPPGLVTPPDNNDNDEDEDRGEDRGRGEGRGEGDGPGRRRGRADRAARIAAALAQVVAGEKDRAERRRMDQEQAQEYLQRARAARPSRGNVPVQARVEAAREHLARTEAEQQQKIDAWAARVAARAGRPLTGGPPRSLEQSKRVAHARARLARAEQADAERTRHPRKGSSDTAGGTKEPAVVRNVTDPDSRLMPTRSGFTQGYNAQSIVTGDGLILATTLTQNPADTTSYQPMVQAAAHAAELLNTTHTAHEPDRPCPRHPHPIGTVLADAGYLSQDNLTAPGPDRLIAIGKHRTLLAAARSRTAPDEHAPTPSPPTASPPTASPPTASPPTASPPTASPPTVSPPTGAVEAMAQRLRTPEGIAAYNQRGHIAETPHGHLKHNLGFRRFSMRGLTKTTAEWTFLCAVANLLKALPTTS